MNALMYHDVVAAGDEDTSGFPGRAAALYKVTPEAFAEHLDAIGCAVPADLAHPAPVVTFDDGGRSAMAAADILERRGRIGHFFVTSNYIGARGFLTGGEIRELARRGHVIGSHSCSHPLRMGHCPWRQLLDEWVLSRSILSEIVGGGVSDASVPGSDFAPQVAEAAARAGITRLFTSEPIGESRNAFGLTLVGRVAIQKSTTAATVAAVAAGESLPCAWHRSCGARRRWPSAWAASGYLQMRKLLLGHGNDMQWGDQR